MPYISECKAPDLSSLGPTLLSRMITGLVFQGRKPPTSESASRLLTAYLSIVDKAVREYSAGREILIAYSKSKNESRLFTEGLGRFETCINSTKRAFRIVERMSAHPDSPTIERTMRRLLKSMAKTITSIRDSIEHIDGDIAAEDVLKTGMAHLLTMNHEGDTLEIANHKLQLADLAKVVSALHKAGCDLLNALPVIEQSENPQV